MLGAFQHRNYRLWFVGQLVSLVGSWMQTTAQGYLVYELTGNPFYLGMVGFAAGAPSWLLMLYGGVISDRISRRSLLIFTQAYLMLLAFILAGLVFTGLVQPWHIVALSALVGVGNAFDAPGRQAFVAELVSRKDLSNAIAFNASMFNLAVIVGPAVGAVTYSLVGPAWCFTINGLTFLAVIGALALMHLPSVTRVRPRTSAGAEIAEGLRFVASHKLILLLIFNLGMLSVFGMSLMTLMPAWAVNVLGGDVQTNGMLLSARGVGALIGALMIASLGSRAVRGRLWTMGNILMPVMMLLFAAMRWLPLSLLFMTGLGWTFMVQANTSNSMVQAQLPDELRGRVMSIYTLVFFGGVPIGSLLVGGMARWIGEPLTAAISAGVLLVLAAAIWLRLPEVRRLS
jgi:MFS family permease